MRLGLIPKNYVCEFEPRDSYIKNGVSEHNII